LLEECFDLLWFLNNRFAFVGLYPFCSSSENLDSKAPINQPLKLSKKNLFT